MLQYLLAVVVSLLAVFTLASANPNDHTIALAMAKHNAELARF